MPKVPNEDRVSFGDQASGKAVNFTNYIKKKESNLMGRVVGGKSTQVSSLGEPINYHENDSVFVRRRKSSDKSCQGEVSMGSGWSKPTGFLASYLTCWQVAHWRTNCLTSLCMLDQ